MYRWALFRHKHLILGRLFELFVVVISLISIALPLISENLVVLTVAAGIAVLCFVLFFCFAKVDKLRRSIHGGAVCVTRSNIR